MRSTMRFIIIPALCLSIVTSALADDRVKKLPPEFRKWLEEEVVYIITNKEKELFLNLETAEERKRFIETFWEKRDPNPATLENEFKIEHYRRIAYANKHLGRDSTRPGWKTDRGHYYIILGKPREIQNYDGLNEVVSNEIWFYQGDTSLGLPARFNLLFFKENDTGEYRLYHPWADGPDALLRAGHFYRVNQNLAVDVLEGVSMDLARASLTIDLSEPVSSFLSARNTRDPMTLYTRPPMGLDVQLANIIESPKRLVDTDYVDAYLRYKDKVSTDYSFRYIPSRSIFTVLRGPKNTPFVHYSLEIDPEHFSLEANDEETRFYTTLDISLEVRDPKDRLVAVNDNSVFIELRPSDMQRVQAYPVAYQDNFPLVVPGNYKVGVTLRNRATKQFTVAEDEVQIPSFGEGAGMSELLVGYQQELVGNAEDEEHLTFQIGNIRLEPAIDHVFSLGETIHVLTQVFGADPEDHVRIRLLDGEQTLQKLDRPLGDYAGGLVLEQLSVPSKGGSYQIVAELVRPAGSVVAERSTPLKVSPRTSIARAGFVYRRGFNTRVAGLLELARGQQFLAIGRVDQAVAELERAVAANNPELPMARWKLAGALLYLRQADRALNLLQPLEEQYPNEYEVVEGLGFAYYFKKDFTRTVTYLEKAMSLRTPDTSVLNALGDSYEELGRQEDAIKVFRRSLELNPEQTGVKQRLQSLSGSGSP